MQIKKKFGKMWTTTTSISQGKIKYDSRNEQKLLFDLSVKFNKLS